MSEQDNNGKEPKVWKIEFAPDCFDSFDGTQEELDELVARIREMAASGELAERAVPVDVDQFEDIDDKVLELLPMLTAGNTRH